MLREGTDVVVDCAGYTAAHARSLLEHASGLGSIVFVSSKAVYVDDRGRRSNSPEPPDFGGPVTERCATLEPSDEDHRTATGYGRNKVAAERVLLDSAVPVSVLRASRIHGPHAANPREWWVVRRVLDGRRHVLLAHGGRRTGPPTAAANLAALVAVCASRPESRILNSADPDAPDGLAISRAIARHLGHDWDEVLLADDAPSDLGDHPWNSVPPFVLDTSASLALGYEPVGDYATTVRAALDRHVQVARAGNPDRVLPAADDPDFEGAFD